MTALSLDQLLDRLGDVAKRPDDDLRSFPPAAYTSEALHALEREKIFRRAWICVGRADEVAAAGAYFTAEIDSVPIVVIRQEDGAVAAFANVCLHRASVLAEGRGRAESLSCPYHGWTYAIDGTLITAPRMPRDLCKSGKRLQALRSELWFGFVFVNLDHQARPLAEGLDALNARLAPYEVDRMVTMRRERFVWQCNWKLLVENGLEAYHIDATHTSTLAPVAPTSKVVMLPGGPGYTVYEAEMADDVALEPPDPALFIPSLTISEQQKSVALVGGVFPSHAFSVTHDWVWWITMQPGSVDKVIVDHGICAAFDLKGAAPDPAHPSFYFLDLSAAFNPEDKIRVEAVQRGVASGLAGQSQLHPQEGSTRDFARYLVRMLRDDAGSPAEAS